MESSGSGNPALDKAVQNWLEWDKKGSESHDRVLAMVRSGNWSELEKIMLVRASFGTAGIRGKMGPGFAQMNDLMIIQTTQGLGKFMLKAASSGTNKPLTAVVGFDGRHNSARWAKLTSRCLIRMGFVVNLFSRVNPTPYVPFAVMHTGAVMGIMITASHNPKDDNGYKVYCDRGHQIVSPMDKQIAKSILDNLVPEGGEAAFEAGLDGQTLVVDCTQDVRKAYCEMAVSLLADKAMNQSLTKRLVYTSMHGVGADYIDEVFKASGFGPVIHVKEQRDPDPDFPTVPFPNPEEGKSALQLAQKTAEENGSIYILANDPDADRLAVAQKMSGGQWKVFNGNEVGSLLGWWQFHVYREHLKTDVDPKDMVLIASTVSSKMLHTIAKAEGLLFEETLTGFKWMASKASELEEAGKTVLLAFEESIGYMCGTQVLDKDGIFAAVRVAELIAFLNQKDLTLTDKLDQLYQTYGYHCSRASYFIHDGPETLKKIFDPLRNHGGAANSYPTELGRKYDIVEVRDLTTGYDSSLPDKAAVLPVDPKTEMITFKFSNGIVATLRSSGTEPKLKYYTEFCAPKEQTDRDKVEKDLEEFVDVLIEEFLQPAKNGLKAKKG